MALIAVSVFHARRAPCGIPQYRTVQRIRSHALDLDSGVAVLPRFPPLVNLPETRSDRSADYRGQTVRIELIRVPCGSLESESTIAVRLWLITIRGV